MSIDDLQNYCLGTRRGIAADRGLPAAGFMYILKESFKDQRWAWEESVRAEKRDRDAEIEKETFRRQRHHQSQRVSSNELFSTSCTFQTGNSCTSYFLSGRFLHKIMLQKVRRGKEINRAIFASILFSENERGQRLHGRAIVHAHCTCHEQRAMSKL